MLLYSSLSVLFECFPCPVGRKCVAEWVGLRDGEHNDWGTEGCSGKISGDEGMEEMRF